MFSAKLSESMHRSRMQYRIQGARMLTGGKSLFVNLPDKLQEVCHRVFFSFFFHLHLHNKSLLEFNLKLNIAKK